MVRDVVSKDKGDLLALHEVDVGNNSRAQHALMLNLLELNKWARVNCIITLVYCHIELKLDILTVERDSL